jgi:hypothetical protein
MTNDAVLSAPLTGEGAPMTTLATLGGPTYENDFTLVSGMLYWSTNTSAVGPAMEGFFRLPATGGTPSMVGPSAIFSLEPVGTGGVGWLEEPTPVVVERDPSQSMDQRIPLPGAVSEFVTDGAHLYWRDDRTGAVYAMPGAGGSASVIAPSEANASTNIGDGWHMLVDQGQVFWADRTLSQGTQQDASVLRVLNVGNVGK